MSFTKRYRPLIFGLLLLAVTGLLAWYFLKPASRHTGVAYGNGRLEATEVDVATKVAGRVSKILAREGDNLAAGQVVAKLDAEELTAQLRAAQAQAQQARENVTSAASQNKLAQATLRRTRELIRKGFISSERLDRDISAQQTAKATLAAARSKVREADARVDELRAKLQDTVLRAPVAGRVLYRLIEPGEFLAAGGKLLTLLEMDDIYMSIYLSTEEAGKVAMDSSARIVLDALPDEEVPAKVVFVAPRSQFTPKEVETRNEREKLMFRIKVKVDQAWLKDHADLAKPGMPGVAYVKTAAKAAWPEPLSSR